MSRVGKTVICSALMLKGWALAAIFSFHDGLSLMLIPVAAMLFWIPAFIYIWKAKP